MPAATRLSTPSPRRFSLGRLIRANLYDLLRLIGESRFALSGFALVMLAGTLYIQQRFRLGYAESLYESFRMLTLQSGLAFPSDPLGRALFFLVPLLGLALILDSVFRFGRLLLDKSTRREAWQVALASTYQNHIIVCGIGRVGLRVVTQILATGHEVVVVDRDWDSEFVKRALALKVPVVVGDAREANVLALAGLMRAHAIVVCISADLVNIEVALNVRSIRPGLRVIQRVFNEDLDRNLEDTFGRYTVFSASALAAPTFAAAALSREVKYVLPLGNEALGVTELVVAPESLMSGFVRKIEEDYGIRVLQHANAAGKQIPPAAMRQLDSGDRVVLIGPLPALQQLRQKNVPKSKAHAALGMVPPQEQEQTRRRVIVCGLGKVGFRVVRQLAQLPNPPDIVCVYSTNSRREFMHELARVDGVTLLEGDARSADVLAAAGLAEAYSVAALTSDDFINMQIGLAARREHKSVHLVMRLFSDVLADQLEELFAIRTVYSTSALAAPTLASAAVLGNVSAAFFSGTALFSTDSMHVHSDDPYVGLSVAQVRERYGVLVIRVGQDSEQAVLPRYDRVIRSGDDLVLLARLDALATLRGAGRLAAHVPLAGASASAG